MIMGRSEFAVSINLFIARQIYLYTALQLQYYVFQSPKASYVVQKVDLDWVLEGIGLEWGGQGGGNPAKCLTFHFVDSLESFWTMGFLDDS